jgi:peptidoglycan hydrolase-like protein with peptidoglycan-binding domain
MANALPILLLGGAALMMMGGKKKKTGGAIAAYPPDIPKPPPLTSTQKTEMSGYGNVTRKKMQWIQTALIINGYDPGVPDGIYTAQTKQAVWEFQEDWGLNPDGKPGKNTQTALKEAEAAAAKEAAPKDLASKEPECQPSNRQTIMQGGDMHDTWGFCNFGRRTRLQDYILSTKNGMKEVSLRVTDFKEPADKVYFSGGNSHNSRIRLTYDAPINSPEAGRVLALAKQAPRSIKVILRDRHVSRSWAFVDYGYKDGVGIDLDGNFSAKLNAYVSGHPE